MVNFAAFARKQGVLLKETPIYRQNKTDAIRTFSQQADRAYATGEAEAIRDARFSRSNEYDVNVALKNRRENMISASTDNYAKDPAQNRR